MLEAPEGSWDGIIIAAVVLKTGVSVDSSVSTFFSLFRINLAVVESDNGDWVVWAASSSTLDRLLERSFAEAS